MAFIYLHSVILTVVFCSMTSHTMLSRTFTVQVNATGSSVCAVDKPTTVVRMAASAMTGRCGVTCNVDPSCELFQFKEDSAQCEMYNYSPSNFSSIDHCTAYAAPPTGMHMIIIIIIIILIVLHNYILLKYFYILLVL